MKKNKATSVSATCSPPLSVAGSASPESLSSAFPAEKALLERRENFVQEAMLARRDAAYFRKIWAFEQAEGRERYAEASEKLVELVDSYLTAGPSAGNGEADRRRRQGTKGELRVKV